MIFAPFCLLLIIGVFTRWPIIILIIIELRLSIVVFNSKTIAFFVGISIRLISFIEDLTIGAEDAVGTSA